ncbi:MAG TPA: hypothetical protein VG738_20780 [Chitinophagaceae bacterium]|nr:hypothetical protein [Chitinophagaceae bacterium]
MLSVKLTMYRSIFIAFILLSFVPAMAQENSPFSRYGLGDLYPQQPVATRAMGGVSAAYSNPQAINTINPASYGNIPIVTFDVGITIDQRTLKSSTPPSTYNSANFLPSYVVFAVPLNRAKGWGGAFGVKPAARINYSVENISRTSVDSLQKLYQGNGGLTQGFIGVGKRWGRINGTNFSLGLNVGYEFGRRETNNIINYVDSTTPYVKSNYGTTTAYSGFFFNPGAQLSINLGTQTDKVTKIRQSYVLHLGAAATLKHELTGSMNTIIETFDYDVNGAMVPIDTISMQNSLSGKIKMPLNYVAGFMLSNMLTDYTLNKWSIAADYSAGKWSEYRFYGQQDQVMDNWMVHAGAEFVPDPFSSGLWSRSTYHLGFYTGKDYINADGNGYNVKAITFGLGFALKRYRGQYDNQQTLINTSFEIGKRGSSINNITENFFKFSVGFSLSDIWFIKRKYD